jgi:hypothetical protein
VFRQSYWTGSAHSLARFFTIIDAMAIDFSSSWNNGERFWQGNSTRRGATPGASLRSRLETGAIRPLLNEISTNLWGARRQ